MFVPFRYRLGALMVLMAVLIVSCGSSKIKSSSLEASYTGGAITSVLVVGISDKLEQRKLYEDTFVGQFKASGVNAVASYTILPTERELKKEEIKSAAQQRNLETTFVTHLVGVEEKEVYTPPMTSSMPYSSMNSYGAYYTSAYRYVNQPGYYTKYELVRLESNLYEVASEKLIWTASTETIDPDKAGKDIDDLSKLILKNMRKNKLIE